MKATIALLIVIPIVLVAMFFPLSASRNVYLDPETGAAARYYAFTPEGYRFYDAPGEDPNYGISLKPVTKDIITAVRAAQAAEFHEYESLNEAPYVFHPATGEPQVWYGGDPAGEFRLFSGPGYDPRTGRPLQPITTAVVTVYQETRRVAEERVALARAERAEWRARQAEADLWAAEAALGHGRRSGPRRFRRTARSGTRQATKHRIGSNEIVISSLRSSDGRHPVNGGKLGNGAKFYDDRPSTVSGVPNEYVGLPYVRLAIQSRHSPITTRISFHVNQAVWVHIAWDHTVPPSPWLLREYESTGRVLYRAEGNWAYRIYRSIEPASGRISTYGQTPSDDSFYLIFVTPW